MSYCSARNNFTLATRAGNDGRKDWMERKLCNFVTGFVQVSFPILLKNASAYKYMQLKIFYYKVMFDSLTFRIVLGCFLTNVVAQKM